MDGQFWPPYVNVFSRDRALLMLFLFSDVSEQDAPTRIRVGSHLAAPACLTPAGEAEMSFLDISSTGLFDITADLPEVLATGRAGDVYLCHPFLVHAAQRHRGTSPRFVTPLHLAARCSSSGPATPAPSWSGRSAGGWARAHPVPPSSGVFLT